MADSPWLTVGVVTSWMEDDPDSPPIAPESRPALLVACNAAAAFVEGKHPGYFVGDPPVYQPPGDVKLGAIMLAARYYARRGSTLGVAGFSEFGPTEILRHDPDVARLLRLGTFAPFGFGAPTPTTTDGTTA